LVFVRTAQRVEGLAEKDKKLRGERRCGGIANPWVTREMRGVGMKRCRHCSRTLGGSASVCPGCGRAVPSAARRWTAAIVAFLFVLALILALLNALTGKAEASVAGTPAPPAAPDEVTAPLVTAPWIMETPAGAWGLRCRDGEEEGRTAVRGVAAPAPAHSHPGMRTR